MKNLPASVRDRLKTIARTSGRPFDEVLMYYGVERFLYRLSKSEDGTGFLLKGALMLRVWGAPGSRPTRDIDLLGFVGNSIENIERIARATCTVEVQEDGLRFDPSTVKGKVIKEDADYQGVRVSFLGFLDRSRLPMQLDVGFGDVVHPDADERDYPTILEGFPAPRLRVYPRETVVAEKFEAMVYLGILNSRLKDFFDIWLLARQFDFSGPVLAEAIRKTFANRETELEVDPVALTSSFTATDATQKQWAALIKRSKLDSAPATLDEIREFLCAFLLPVVTVLVEGREFTSEWVAPGPWQDA